MDFVIDRGVIGTDRHLLVSDEWCWVDDVPSKTWHLSGGVKNDNEWCLDSLFKLEGVELTISPPQKFVSAMELVLSGSDVWPPPWERVMPEEAFQSFLAVLVSQVVGSIENVDKKYYRDTWVAQNEVFGSFYRARIDHGRWRALLEDSNNGKIVKSFVPDPTTHLAQHVVYDRFGTRTGRLTTESGPMMLNLRKDLRKELVLPLEPGDALYMLDYAALEMRVLLYESGFRCEEADMYEMIRRKHLSGIERDKVKGAVICSTYGMKKHAWGHKVGLDGKDLDRVDEVLHGLFGANELLKRLKSDFVKTGYIRNRFGRKVVIEEPQDRLIMNAYAQSTGADVALLGFRTLLPFFKKKNVKPHFLLHDAVMVSAPKGTFDSVMKVKTPGYIQKFVIKATEL